MTGKIKTFYPQIVDYCRDIGLELMVLDYSRLTKFILEFEPDLCLICG